MKSRAADKIKLTSYNDLLGVGNEENSMEIDISRIVAFPNHPYKVEHDSKMDDLINSIQVNGLLTPVLVTPEGADKYRMISGHRRVYACSKLGYSKIQAIVRDMSEDEAIIAMVDANLQREELLPSERAFAYRMKMEALNRQGQRTDLTFGRKVQKWCHEEFGQSVGMSGRHVNRYIRLTELIPDLLRMVDNKRLSLMLGVELSYLPKLVQKWVSEYIHENGILKQQQVDKLRNELEVHDLTQAEMIVLMNECIKQREQTRKLILSDNKLGRFFPKSYSSHDIEKVIMELLENWTNQNNKAGV